MEILNAGIQLDSFLKNWAASPQRLLFLDYDGTLAPFHSQRDKARLYPGVEESLNQILQKGKTRIWIVSGRSVENLKQLLPKFQGIEIWGCHGSELLDFNGNYYNFLDSELSENVLKEAKLQIVDFIPSQQIELKPFGLAIHWRGMNEIKISEWRQKIEAAWSSLPSESGFKVQYFDGGIELSTAQRSKANAILDTLALFPPETPCAFLGDDLTDENAFAALQDRGLSILVDSPRRPTLADLWIQAPKELLECLSWWV